MKELKWEVSKFVAVVAQILCMTNGEENKLQIISDKARKHFEKMLELCKKGEFTNIKDSYTGKK